MLCAGICLSWVWVSARAPFAFLGLLCVNTCRLGSGWCFLFYLFFRFLYPVLLLVVGSVLLVAGSICLWLAVFRRFLLFVSCCCLAHPCSLYVAVETLTVALFLGLDNLSFRPRRHNMRSLRKCPGSF